MTSIGVLFKFIFSQTTSIKSFSKSNFLLSYYIITVVIVLLVTALQMMGLKLFKVPFYFQNKILKYKSVQNLISNKTALKKMMLFKKKNDVIFFNNTHFERAGQIIINQLCSNQFQIAQLLFSLSEVKNANAVQKKKN